MRILNLSLKKTGLKPKGSRLKADGTMAFTKTIQSETLLFDFDGEIDAFTAQTLAEAVAAELKDNPSLKKIVLDLKDQHGIRPDSMRVFSPLGLELRRHDRTIFVLNAPRAVKSLIHQLGMELILRPITADQLAPAAASAARPKAKIDVKLINPFITGVMHVLKVQCSLECTPKQPSLKADFSSPPRVDIAGVIGITSPTFNGSIALCLSEKVFLGVMSNMLGETYEKITPDLTDGAGELLNIIFGHAKKLLSEQGTSLGMAIPTVVSGSDIAVGHSSATQALILPFESPLGEFYIEIGTKDA